jgi:FKBP12-rapamycin complex-associated protein
MHVQHIRKYLEELLYLISELWSSFGFPATSRPSLGYPVSLVFLGTITCMSYCYIDYRACIFYGNYCFHTYTLLFAQVLHLVEQLCLALNDEFRKHLPRILPGCIQVLSDAERCNDYTYVPDILHTLKVFGG